MTEIQTKRVYEDPHGNDGYRVFVDRLWPRGESKENFRYDLWPTNLAPSASLREWFHLDTSGRWEEFRKKYLDELQHSQAAMAFKQKVAEKPLVTLLYSSKDTEHNNAVVLKEFLQN